MSNMEKRMHKRTTGPAKNNEGHPLGLLHTLDFQQASNSRRLHSNGEHGNGRIPADKRYSRRVLDLLSDFAEKDRGSSLPCQDEAKNDIQQGVKCRKNSHFSDHMESIEVHARKQPDAQMNHDGNHPCELFDKLSHMEEVTTPEALHQSDDLLDTLKVLSSDKELLYQLIWDPQSNSMNQVQKLENPRRSNILGAASVKFFEKQNALKVFRKDKGSDIQKPKGSLMKTVVLNPILSRTEDLSAASSFIPSPRSSQSTGSHMGNRRATSAFSFQELKNRLKHAIGERKKERRCRSNGIDVQNGVRLPNNGVKTRFSAINSCSTENDNGVENRYRQKPREKNQEKRNIHDLKTESNFQRDTKKDLTVMLHSKYDCGHWQEKRTSKASWNRLSFEDYDFPPVHRPRRQKKLCLSQQMRFGPLSGSNDQGNSEKGDLARLNSESSHHSSTNEDAASHALDLSSELLDSKSEDEDSTIEVTTLEGQAKIVDNDNSYNKTNLENTRTLDEMSDEGGQRMARLDETHADVKTQSQRLESSMETKSTTPSNHPSTLPIHKKEAPAIIMEKLEHPSPVSVLIPPFTDDATSISSPVSEEWDEGLSISPRKLLSDDYNKSEDVYLTSYFKREPEAQMEMEEFNLRYVGSLLDASGLIHVETWRRKQSLCNLLDPALFDEVETPFGEIPCDLKHLFDCIVEAVEGIREKYCPQKPWAAFAKPNVRPFPCRESLVQEVCGKITSHQAALSRNSMNQVIEKDLDTIVWMDTSAETEIDDIGFAIEDEMFDELLEELIAGDMDDQWIS